MGIARQLPLWPDTTHITADTDCQGGGERGGLGRVIETVESQGGTWTGRGWRGREGGMR